MTLSIYKNMTTTQVSPNKMTKGVQEALVDQLRACKSQQEILDFEQWFNSKTDIGPLSEVICNFLRTRSISRGLAAKWLSTLIKNKEEKINSL
tara:strand:- start:1559 stop:1837 length:279 start_codon:yes stop_codon:yes gene_type:complete